MFGEPFTSPRTKKSNATADSDTPPPSFCIPQLQVEKISMLAEEVIDLSEKLDQETKLRQNQEGRIKKSYQRKRNMKKLGRREDDVEKLQVECARRTDSWWKC